MRRQIGQLKMELDWLKKIAVAPVLKKRAEVDPAHPAIPVVRQCDLLDLAPSTFYCRPARDEGLNLELMRRLDEEYTKHPFYGSRKLVARLRKAGYAVNRKRVQGLMRRLAVRSGLVVVDDAGEGVLSGGAARLASGLEAGDRAEIVVPGSNGEDIYSRLMEKMALRDKKS